MEEMMEVQRQLDSVAHLLIPIPGIRLLCKRQQQQRISRQDTTSSLSQMQMRLRQQQQLPFHNLLQSSFPSVLLWQFVLVPVTRSPPVLQEETGSLPMHGRRRENQQLAF